MIDISFRTSKQLYRLAEFFKYVFFEKKMQKFAFFFQIKRKSWKNFANLMPNSQTIARKKISKKIDFEQVC